jgi:hypothetical protein
MFGRPKTRGPSIRSITNATRKAEKILNPKKIKTAVFGKFGVPDSPLMTEETIYQMVPTTKEVKKRQEAKFETVHRILKTQLDAIRDEPGRAFDKNIKRAHLKAKMDAISFLESQEELLFMKDEINSEFAKDFILWLQGKTTSDPENDLARTPWRKQPLLLPDVKEYLAMIVDKRMDYMKELILLQKFPPTNLKQCFMFFKYIVRGHQITPKDMDYLEFIDDRNYLDPGWQYPELQPFKPYEADGKDYSKDVNNNNRPDSDDDEPPPPKPPPAKPDSDSESEEEDKDEESMDEEEPDDETYIDPEDLEDIINNLHTHSKTTLAKMVVDDNLPHQVQEAAQEVLNDKLHPVELDTVMTDAQVTHVPEPAAAKPDDHTKKPEPKQPPPSAAAAPVTKKPAEAEPVKPDSAPVKKPVPDDDHAKAKVPKPVKTPDDDHAMVKIKAHYDAEIEKIRKEHAAAIKAKEDGHATTIRMREEALAEADKQLSEFKKEKIKLMNETDKKVSEQARLIRDLKSEYEREKGNSAQKEKIKQELQVAITKQAALEDEQQLYMQQSAAEYKKLQESLSESERAHTRALEIKQQQMDALHEDHKSSLENLKGAHKKNFETLYKQYSQELAVKDQRIEHETKVAVEWKNTAEQAAKENAILKSQLDAMTKQLDMAINAPRPTKRMGPDPEAEPQSTPIKRAPIVGDAVPLHEANAAVNNLRQQAQEALLAEQAKNKQLQGQLDLKEGSMGQVKRHLVEEPTTIEPTPIKKTAVMAHDAMPIHEANTAIEKAQLEAASAVSKGIQIEQTLKQQLTLKDAAIEKMQKELEAYKVALNTKDYGLAAVLDMKANTPVEPVPIQAAPAPVPVIEAAPAPVPNTAVTIPEPQVVEAIPDLKREKNIRKMKRDFFKYFEEKSDPYALPGKTNDATITADELVKIPTGKTTRTSRKHNLTEEQLAKAVIASMTPEELLEHRRRMQNPGRAGIVV